MDLADAFLTSGGDASATGWLLALAGTACLAAAILLQLRVPEGSDSDDADANADAGLESTSAESVT